MTHSGSALRLAIYTIVAACPLSVGCVATTFQQQVQDAAYSDVPRELQKVTHPPYRVEPPDILLIEAVNNIRPPESPLQAGDELLIQLADGEPIDPLADPLLNQFKIVNNYYLVQSDGTVDLGPEYGSVTVAGLTVKEAQQAIDRYLREQFLLDKPKVAVSLPNVAGKQLITGDHLIRPDGTVSLGVYGNVFVAGMTLDEIKAALEEYLAQSIHQPEVSVDVLSYNSKVYYIVTDGGGFGEQVVRIPYTGNETVLDALSQIQGLPEVSSKKMWIARPAPAGANVSQTLKIDWRGITQDGVTTTNYQLFPGDRIYISADEWITLDNIIAKVTAPVQRIAGFILLGNGTIRRLQLSNVGGGGFGGGFGGF